MIPSWRQPSGQGPYSYQARRTTHTRHSSLPRPAPNIISDAIIDNKVLPTVENILPIILIILSIFCRKSKQMVDYPLWKGLQFGTGRRLNKLTKVQWIQMNIHFFLPLRASPKHVRLKLSILM